MTSPKAQGPSWARQHGPANWVSDGAKMLSAAERQQVNGVCQRLFDKYGVEVAVVTLNDIRALQTPREFFTQVFNAWGIGHPTVNNGLLVALVLEKRRLEMVTGDGMRKVLTDDTLKALQQREMVPLLGRGRWRRAWRRGWWPWSARSSSRLAQVPSRCPAAGRPRDKGRSSLAVAPRPQQPDTQHDTQHEVNGVPPTPASNRVTMGHSRLHWRLQVGLGGTSLGPYARAATSEAA